MTRAQRQALWTAMATGTGEFQGKITITERQRASELLGKSQADFVEVRVAPIVTDQQMGEDELLGHVRGIFERIQQRANQQRAERNP